MSFVEREKPHVEGFKAQLDLVTHAGGKELEERVREELKATILVIPDEECSPRTRGELCATTTGS